MAHEKVGSWESGESSSRERYVPDISPRGLSAVRNRETVPGQEITERILDLRDFETVRQKAASWLSYGALHAAGGAYAFKMTEPATYNEMYTPGVHRPVLFDESAYPDLAEMLQMATPEQRLTALGFAYASVPRLAPENLGEIPQMPRWQAFENDARTYLESAVLDRADKKVTALVVAAALSRIVGAKWEAEPERRAFARRLWKELREEAMPKLGSTDGAAWSQMAKAFRSLYDCSPSFFNSEIRKTPEWLGFVDTINREAETRAYGSGFDAGEFAECLAVANELTYGDKLEERAGQ